MKTIFKIFYTGLIFAFITSCDLEELPKSQGNRDTIFGSSSGLTLYTNSFYEMLPNTEDGVYLIDDNSDIVARNGVDSRFVPNALSAVTSSGWSWGNLRNINFFIENCEQSTVSGKEHFLGMAHFFRAYFYFGMVKRFGDVPWIDRPIEVDDDEKLNAPRDNRFEVMEHVLADLNYAIQNISLESDPSCTRITKNVARVFKTRVCLYEASLRKYHTGYQMQGSANQWFQEVVNTANDITGFTLSTRANAYREMFLQKSPWADETILCVALDGGLQLYNSRNRKTISPTYANRPAFTRRFILTYLNADGTSFTTSNPNWRTTTFVEEMKGRDPRLAQTIRRPDYVRTEYGAPTPAPPNFEQTWTGYQIIKGCYDERFPYDDESRNENAHLIYRYAEVLLNKAEALAELGQMTQATWAETIGALRARAGITGPTLTTLPTEADPYMVDFYNGKFTDPIMLEVLRERCIEMVMEGLRPDDLVRWRLGELFEAPLNGMYIPALGTYDFNDDGINDVCFFQGDRPAGVTATAFVNVTPSTAVGMRQLSNGTSGEVLWNPGVREWLDKKYLYPIPENDRIRNPALGQNPGWE